MSDDILAISEQLEALQKRLNAVGRKYLITHDHLEDIISEVRKMEAMAEATKRIDFDALLMAANELPPTAQPRALHIRRLVLELSGALAALEVRVSSDTKPDVHCVIEELYDLEVLPFGWVLLRRANKNNPDYIGIKYLGGLDPLARIAELETENKLLKKKHHPDCNVFISISQDMPEPPYCTCGYEQLEAELADIGHRLSCVLDHATGGRMSKTNYTKEAMYAEIDSYYQNLRAEVETELDTERSMRHEAQSDYGNLMEKTEALEAEFGEVKHVLDMVGIEHSGHRSQGDRVRMLADDRDRAMTLAKSKVKRANILRAGAKRLKLELIKERLKWLSDALGWDEITKKQHDEQAKQLRIMKESLDA